MNNKGWVLLGGLGFLAAACGGKGVINVGELNGSAGASGVEGSGQGSTASNVGGKTGGNAGQPPASEVFYEGPSDVRAIAASNTTLYWVEYGSEDSLGNFQNDGRLLARDFDSDEVRVLADDLPGAEGVVLTGTHAYVYVDQYLADGGPRPALVRMTLAGADYELVRLLLLNDTGNSCVGCLVGVDGAAFFVDDDSIFRVSDEDPTAVPFLEQPGYSMAVDETTLYVAAESGILQAPLTTGIATQLSTRPRRSLQTSGTYLYGIDDEDPSGVFLARIPKAGGTWERLAPRRDADVGSRLRIVDDLFFQHLYLPEGNPGCRWSLSCFQFVQGNLKDTAAAQVVLELPKDVTAWVGTTAGVFWTDRAKIRHVPLAVE